MITFQINKNNQTTDFPHYWEQCVGSCHGYTALREDYRAQLKKAHDELGFQYVRFHGIFDDDMSVCVERRDHSGNSLGLQYNFVNIDNIFDFLLSIEMKPFIEIGFMPSCLASGNTTCFYYKGNVTPPRDYALWNDFIQAFAEHLIERYGLEEVKTWFFEVWNEPNLAFFFDGTQAQYFELYENTARTIKSVSQALRVGGPATSINAWIPEMIDFCETGEVPLDFVSTHHYPTDDPLWKNNDMSMEEFFATMGSELGKYERGILKKMTQRAASQAGSYPLYYTEWNTSAMTNDDQHDECYAASLVAKTLADNDGLVKGYSFWTFTDIFEESAQLKGAFHGGFGLQTVYGVEKPVYRTFELFHGLGNTRYPVVTDRLHANVELIATKTHSGMRLIAFNHNIPGGEMETETFQLELTGFEVPKEIVIYRIDNEHVNPKKAWQDMGAPEYLKADQIDALREASRLVPQQGSQDMTFTIGEYGVLGIDLIFN